MIKLRFKFKDSDFRVQVFASRTLGFKSLFCANFFPNRLQQPINNAQVFSDNNFSFIRFSLFFFYNQPTTTTNIKTMSDVEKQQYHQHQQQQYAYGGGYYDPNNGNKLPPANMMMQPVQNVVVEPSAPPATMKKRVVRGAGVCGMLLVFALIATTFFVIVTTKEHKCTTITSYPVRTNCGKTDCLIMVDGKYARWMRGTECPVFKDDHCYIQQPWEHDDYNIPTTLHEECSASALVLGNGTTFTRQHIAQKGSCGCLRNRSSKGSNWVTSFVMTVNPNVEFGIVGDCGCTEQGMNEAIFATNPASGAAFTVITILFIAAILSSVGLAGFLIVRCLRRTSKVNS